MDRYILGLKSFIDGLGVRDVEFPDELTEQELTLIVELFVTAAATIETDQLQAIKTMMSKLRTRLFEELPAEQVNELFLSLSKK